MIIFLTVLSLISLASPLFPLSPPKDILKFLRHYFEYPEDNYDLPDIHHPPLPFPPLPLKKGLHPLKIQPLSPKTMSQRPVPPQVIKTSFTRTALDIRGIPASLSPFTSKDRESLQREYDHDVYQSFHAFILYWTEYKNYILEQSLHDPLIWLTFLYTLYDDVNILISKLKFQNHIQDHILEIILGFRPPTQMTLQNIITFNLHIRHNIQTQNTIALAHLFDTPLGFDLISLFTPLIDKIIDKHLPFFRTQNHHQLQSQFLEDSLPVLQFLYDHLHFCKGHNPHLEDIYKTLDFLIHHFQESSRQDLPQRLFHLISFRLHFCSVYPHFISLLNNLNIGFPKDNAQQDLFSLITSSRHKVQLQSSHRDQHLRLFSSWEFVAHLFRDIKTFYEHTPYIIKEEHAPCIFRSSVPLFFMALFFDPTCLKKDKIPFHALMPSPPSLARSPKHSAKTSRPLSSSQTSPFQGCKETHDFIVQIMDRHPQERYIFIREHIKNFRQFTRWMQALNFHIYPSSGKHPLIFEHRQFPQTLRYAFNIHNYQQSYWQTLFLSAVSKIYHLSRTERQKILTHSYIPPDDAPPLNLLEKLHFAVQNFTKKNTQILSHLSYQKSLKLAYHILEVQPHIFNSPTSLSILKGDTKLDFLTSVSSYINEQDDQFHTFMNDLQAALSSLPQHLQENYRYYRIMNRHRDAQDTTLSPQEFQELVALSDKGVLREIFHTSSSHSYAPICLHDIISPYIYDNFWDLYLFHSPSLYDIYHIVKQHLLAHAPSPPPYHSSMPTLEDSPSHQLPCSSSSNASSPLMSPPPSSPAPIFYPPPQPSKNNLMDAMNKTNKSLDFMVSFFKTHSFYTLKNKPHAFSKKIEQLQNIISECISYKHKASSPVSYELLILMDKKCKYIAEKLDTLKYFISLSHGYVPHLEPPLTEEQSLLFRPTYSHPRPLPQLYQTFDYRKASYIFSFIPLSIFFFNFALSYLYSPVTPPPHMSPPISSCSHHPHYLDDAIPCTSSISPIPEFPEVFNPVSDFKANLIPYTVNLRLRSQTSQEFISLIIQHHLFSSLPNDDFPQLHPPTLQHPHFKHPSVDHDIFYDFLDFMKTPPPHGEILRHLPPLYASSSSPHHTPLTLQEHHPFPPFDTPFFSLSYKRSTPQWRYNFHLFLKQLITYGRVTESDLDYIKDTIHHLENNHNFHDQDESYALWDLLYVVFRYAEMIQKSPSHRFKKPPFSSPLAEDIQRMTPLFKILKNSSPFHQKIQDIISLLDHFPYIDNSPHLFDDILRNLLFFCSQMSDTNTLDNPQLTQNILTRLYFRSLQHSSQIPSQEIQLSSLIPPSPTAFHHYTLFLATEMRYHLFHNIYHWVLEYTPSLHLLSLNPDTHHPQNYTFENIVKTAQILKNTGHKNPLFTPDTLYALYHECSDHFDKNNTLTLMDYVALHARTPLPYPTYDTSNLYFISPPPSNKQKMFKKKWTQHEKSFYESSYTQRRNVAQFKNLHRQHSVLFKLYQLRLHLEENDHDKVQKSFHETQLILTDHISYHNHADIPLFMNFLKKKATIHPPFKPYFLGIISQITNKFLTYYSSFIFPPFRLPSFFLPSVGMTLLSTGGLFSIIWSLRHRESSAFNYLSQQKRKPSLSRTRFFLKNISDISLMSHFKDRPFLPQDLLNLMTAYLITHTFTQKHDRDTDYVISHYIPLCQDSLQHALIFLGTTLISPPRPPDKDIALLLQTIFLYFSPPLPYHDLHLTSQPFISMSYTPSIAYILQNLENIPQYINRIHQLRPVPPAFIFPWIFTEKQTGSTFPSQTKSLWLDIIFNHSDKLPVSPDSYTLNLPQFFAVINEKDWFSKQHPLNEFQDCQNQFKPNYRCDSRLAPIFEKLILDLNLTPQSDFYSALSLSA